MRLRTSGCIDVFATRLLRLSSQSSPRRAKISNSLFRSSLHVSCVPGANGPEVMAALAADSSPRWPKAAALAAGGIVAVTGAALVVAATGCDLAATLKKC